MNSFTTKNNIKKRDLLISAILCLSGVLFFYSFTISHSILALNRTDALFAFLPRYSYIAESIKNTGFNFWNPFLNLGQPIVDAINPYNFISIVFYLIFEPWTANSLYILFGLWCLFFFSWLSMRIFGFDNLSSFVGSFIYSLSGIIFYFHSYNPYGYAFLPLSLALIWSWDKEKKTHVLAMFFMVLIISVFSAGLYNLLIILYAIFITRLIAAKNRKDKYLYISLWSILLLFLYLGLSCYTIPLREWATESTRRFIPIGRTNEYYPDIKNILSAFFTGKFLSINDQPYEGSYYYYFGIWQFLLAIFGLIKIIRNKNNLLFLFLVSLVFPLIYIGFRLLYHFKFSFIPDIAYWKGMAFTVFILAMLSAYGFKILKSGPLLKKIFAYTLVALSLIMSTYLAKDHIKEWCYSGNAKAYRAVKKYNDLLISLLDKSGDKGRFTNYGPRKLEFIALSHREVFPIYSNTQNKRLEKALKKDDLISLPKNPADRNLWWEISNPDAEKLALYGVKYMLLGNSEKIPDHFRSGWKYDTRFQGLNMWVNQYYKGRSYILSQDGNIKNIKVSTKYIGSEKVECIVHNASYGDTLVLADLAFPKWSVTVNSIPKKWSIYHNCLRQVSLDPGENIVIWDYDKTSEKKGIYITVFSLLSFIITIICLKKYLY